MASIWLDTSSQNQTYKPLTKDVTTDVVVIGGGISGITTAYMLASKGVKVVLLEKNTLGSGITAYTTAMITMVIDKSFGALISMLGRDKATAFWQSGQTAIRFIETVIQKEHISCDYTPCPAYMFARDRKSSEHLAEEASLANEQGFPVSFHTDASLPFRHVGYMTVEDQAKFHPLSYIRSLAKAAVSKGAVIHEGTAAHDISGSGSVVVSAGSYTVTASYAVIATQSPIGNPMSIIGRILPYNSYVISALIPRNTLPDAIYWDTDSPYHYFRIDHEHHQDRITLGGEDHKTGHADMGSPYEALESYLATLLPGVDYTVDTLWSAQVLNTVDGLPFAGSLPFHRNRLVATGYNGTGMAYSTAAAMVNTDIILSRKNEWHDIYSPTRLHAAGALVKHGMEAMKDFASGILPADYIEETQISPGTGHVVTIRGKKIAVYKDKNGRVTRISAICTHLGCTVTWNQRDTTWDCPCHGSRFSVDGMVLQGPAQKPLKAQ